VIEVAFPKPKEARIKWINSVIDTLHFEKNRVAEIRAAEGDVAVYLDHNCRNALSHVFIRPLINPDDHADYMRIFKDLNIVKRLATMAIQNGHVD
jgi:hypothetical protein